jgi:CheY-like chemotaxis protein
MQHCGPHSFPDLIFLDVAMPGTNGWDFLREIKRMMAAHRAPIVMWSSSDLLLLGYSPSDVGAAAFMKKADNAS